MAFKIDENTIIDVGMQLSRNFNLSHLTSGAYSPITASWMPRFTSTLIPDSSLVMNLTGGANIPLYKIVQNLQAGAEGMLEGLLNGFGRDLIIKSAFSNNIPYSALANEVQHLIGNSFDIQIAGFEHNMYGVMKELSKFTKVADSLNLVFGDSSWLHVNVNPEKLGVSSSMLPDPSFVTTNLATGLSVPGLSAINGFM